MTRVFPGDQRLARQHLALGNYARAYELDPTLRHEHSRLMALDAATEEQLISRAIRTARTAAPRRAPQRILPMFDSNALLQRVPGDAGYRERRSGHFALDEARPGGAAEHIRKALNHVKYGEELDEQRLCRYLDHALAALSASGARDDSDEDEVGDPVGRGGPRPIRDRDRDEEEFGRRLGDRHSRARDAMGEVPSRSSVSTRGLRDRVDHRRDFNNRSQGGAESGADSRHGFDAAALLQRSGTR